MTELTKVGPGAELGRGWAWHAAMSCLALLVIAMLGPVPASAQTKEYGDVDWKGHPVDNCLYPGAQCGKPAADKFCVLNGHAEATGWSIITGIGESFPTLMLGNMQMCNGPQCDAFLMMTCRLKPAPTVKDQLSTSAAATALPRVAPQRGKVTPKPEARPVDSRVAPTAPAKSELPLRVEAIPGGPPPIMEAKLVTTFAAVQPAQPTAGQQISVSASVQNQGGLTSQAGFGLLLLCDTTPTHSKCPATTFPAATLPGLASGEIHHTVIHTGMPWAAGKYRLVIGTDVIFDNDARVIELVVGPAPR